MISIYHKLIPILFLTALSVVGYCQDEEETVFRVGKTAPIISLTKDYYYQRTDNTNWRANPDTTYCNLISVVADTFYYRIMSGQSITRDTSAVMKDRPLLFSFQINTANKLSSISYKSDKGNSKTSTIFFNEKEKPVAVNFWWTQFLTGADTSISQMAYYLDDNAIATIDTSIYNCIKIVYLRDTIVPNSAPVKIKGRSWNFGIGRHKETIATYVYLRKSDYLPVEVVELFPDKKVKVSTPSKRDVKTTWFLKNRIE